MSAFPRPALSAIAFQLAGALETYEARIDEVLTPPLSLAACRQASDQLDEVVMLKGALPQLAVQTVELLVCHTELMHVLWGAVKADARARADLVTRLQQAIRAMHGKCLRLFCLGGARA
jgi:hypothetical protein